MKHSLRVSLLVSLALLLAAAIIGTAVYHRRQREAEARANALSQMRDSLLHLKIALDAGVPPPKLAELRNDMNFNFEKNAEYLTNRAWIHQQLDNNLVAILYFSQFDPLRPKFDEPDTEYRAYASLLNVRLHPDEKGRWNSPGTLTEAGFMFARSSLDVFLSTLDQPASAPPAPAPKL